MPSEPDHPARWRALAAGALDLAQQLSDPGAKEAMIVVAEQYTALAEGAERLTTRALVRMAPKTTWKSKAVDRLIIGMVGFLWGVLLGGFAAYWAPPAGDTLHSRKRAELCIEARELGSRCGLGQPAPIDARGQHHLDLPGLRHAPHRQGLLG
jgi:hypothetical protein